MSTPPFNGKWRFEQQSWGDDPLIPTLRKLARRYCLELEGMDEDEFVEVLSQAIWCGDFACLVIGHKSSGKPIMEVTYKPFRHAQDLEERIDKLETLLDARCPGWRDA